jgi:flagellar hook-basal body complex protein FliE
MNINPISLPNNINKATDEKNRNNNDVSFGDILKQAINSVNELQKVNAQNNYLLAAGEIDSIHKVMIDAEKADIVLQFTIQIRNKVLEAYQEIMRMQI